MASLRKALVAAGAIAAVTGFGVPAHAAYGDAPWCAIINMGLDVTWDCQYQTVEQCTPHVIAGNRGFCNLNPNPGPAAVAKSSRYKRHSSAK